MSSVAYLRANLADDDHEPLSLHEILLAGCPTSGVRTVAVFLLTGETGVMVDGAPPGALCAESDGGVRALAVCIEAVKRPPGDGSPQCARSGS